MTDLLSELLTLHAAYETVLNSLSAEQQQAIEAYVTQLELIAITGAARDPGTVYMPVHHWEWSQNVPITSAEPTSGDPLPTPTYDVRLHDTDSAAYDPRLNHNAPSPSITLDVDMNTLPARYVSPHLKPHQRRIT